MPAFIRWYLQNAASYRKRQKLKVHGSKLKVLVAL